MAGPEPSYRLAWSRFGANLAGAFRDLHQDRAFADVTLACKDGEVGGHRVVLAAASPLLQTILRRLQHPHPLIYLQGVKVATVGHIMEFLYTGEVTVKQAHLDSLLAAAEELEVRGLAQSLVASQAARPGLGEEEPVLLPEGLQEVKLVVEGKEPEQEWWQEEGARELDSVEKQEGFYGYDEQGYYNGNNGEIKNCEDDIHGEDALDQHKEEAEATKSKEINQQLLTSIERTGGRQGYHSSYRCKTCGRVSRDRNTAMKHCETHLGLAHTCTICSVVYKSRRTLAKHYIKIHKIRRPSLGPC